MGHHEWRQRTGRHRRSDEPPPLRQHGGRRGRGGGLRRGPVLPAGQHRRGPVPLRPVRRRRRVGRPDRPRGRPLDAAGARAAGAGGGMAPENVEVALGARGRRRDEEGRARGARRSPRPSSATRSTSRWMAWSPTAGTGTASAPATPRARSAGPARCPPRARAATSCGSPSPRASTTRRACTPPTSTWPRTTSTWSSTSATTSTRGRAGTARSASMSGRRSGSLEDYRIRHAQYKTDPHLQAMHALCPWVVTWDDHEVDNNYAGADLRGEGGRPGRLPGASGQRLPGLLRDDAAAPAVAAARPAHAALSDRLVRQAGGVPGARHPPVPRRPAAGRAPRAGARAHGRPWGRTRSAGCGTAWPARTPAGTWWPSRSSSPCATRCRGSPATCSPTPGTGTRPRAPG